jgi:hypothetical protein
MHLFLLARMLKHQSSLFSNTLLQDTSWCLWMRLGKFKILSWICEILNDVQIQDVIGISAFFCESFHIVKNVLKKKIVTRFWVRFITFLFVAIVGS